MTIRKVDGGYVHSQAWPTAGEPDFEAECRKLNKLLLKAEYALTWATDNHKFPAKSPPVKVLEELLKELYEPVPDEK